MVDLSHFRDTWRGSYSLCPLEDGWFQHTPVPVIFVVAVVATAVAVLLIAFEPISEH